VAGAFFPDLAGQAASPDSDESPAIQLDRQKAYLQQLVHQTTHSLARFFLEIDANYKQFKTASRLRAEAASRLEAQRASYEEGRVAIDRFLDAVSQYATAVATEAQYKAAYNISLVGLEECKGTLLEHDHITFAEGDAQDVPQPSRPDTAVKPAAFQPPAPTAAPTGPAPPSPIEPDDARTKTRPTKTATDGTTYSFHLTIGAGDRPFEIRGSLTVAPAGRP
jgi:hypothetical protein